MRARSRTGLVGFEVERYRAFETPTPIELGRITLLLGRNNAGKTALCLAPIHFAHAFRADANAPLPAGSDESGFGSPQSAIYRRAATGMRFKFTLEQAEELAAVELGVTVLPERNNEQRVTQLTFHRPGQPARRHGLMAWPEAQKLIAQHPELAVLPDEVRGLRGVRPPPPRHHPYPGYTPRHVGLWGEDAATLLLSAGETGLDKVNSLYEQLGVRLAIEKRKDTFEVLATGTSGEPVNLVDSGAGIAQVLPLFTQLQLAGDMPTLWCVEQPELHLHPSAHPLVADALLSMPKRHPHCRLLLETHSDALVLRLRRRIAEGEMKSEDLRVYFVDERADEGTVALPVPLDTNGTPEWWPDGVFAEPQQEYFAIRRAITARARASP